MHICVINLSVVKLSIWVFKHQNTAQSKVCAENLAAQSLMLLTQQLIGYPVKSSGTHVNMDFSGNFPSMLFASLLI